MATLAPATTGPLITMSAWLLSLWNPMALLPTVPMQSLFHALVWLAISAWCLSSALPLADRRMRWWWGSLAGALLLAWPPVLQNLGLVFQTPSLMTLCVCVTAAWLDVRGRSTRLFANPSHGQMGRWIWLGCIGLGWVLCLDNFGLLPWDIYSVGFRPEWVWLGWMVSGLWMVASYLLALDTTHRTAATCWMMATALFAFTHAPTGNVWDAWMDPLLWLYAHVKWFRSGRAQGTRINHS